MSPFPPVLQDSKFEAPNVTGHATCQLLACECEKIRQSKYNIHTVFIVYLVYNVLWYTYAIFNYPYMFNYIFNILVIF